MSIDPMHIETQSILPATVDVADAQSFASELADAARPIAMRYFRSALEVDHKADESPVTIADRLIEKTLRDMISKRFPAHGIYGEEMGIKSGNGLTWVIDPIDGTKSFITGVPLFGTLIALIGDEGPLFGLIDIPATGERWIGAVGRTLFNGEPARTSRCSRLSAARFYTTSPETFAGETMEGYRRIAQAVALRRFGGDCYSYGLLASGHCDLVVEAGLQPYDYMALVPVIRHAGGVISDWDGNALTLASDGRVVAAATPALHADALALLTTG